MFKKINKIKLNRSERNFCCSLSSVQMVKLLVAKGGTINAQDKKERRPLHWAAYMGEEEWQKCLSLEPFTLASKNPNLSYIRVFRGKLQGNYP